MAVDCSNTLAIKEAVCKNATDMQEMITGGVDDTTTNYGAKTVLRMVKDRTEGASPFFGVDYVWIDEIERNLESGMINKEFGYQADTNEVYRYNGSSWILQTTFEIVSMDSVEGSIGRINNPLCDIPFNNNLDVKQGNGNISISRSTTDTKNNIYGNIEDIAINEANIEDGITNEDTSTNYLFPSDGNTNTDLGFTRSIISGEYGDYDAIRLTEDTTENQRRFRDTTPSPITTTIGDFITASVIVGAKGGRENIALLLEFNGSNIVEFTLSDESVGSVSIASDTFIDGYVENLGNDMYKLSFTIQVVASYSYVSLWTFFSNDYGNGNATYIGDGTSFIDYIGGQVEKQDFASSYIPTVSSSSTRTIPYITFPSKYNMPSQKEGTISFDVNMKSFQNSYNYVLSCYEDSNNNFRIAVLDDKRIRVIIVNNGNTIVSLPSFGTIDRNTWNKITIAWSNQDLKIYINSSLDRSTSFVGNLFGTSILNTDFRLGSFDPTSTSSVANMKLKNFKTYNFAITPTELKLLG